MPCLKFARKEQLHKKKVSVELSTNESLISWYVWIKKLGLTCALTAFWNWRIGHWLLSSIHPSSAALSKQSKQSNPDLPLSEHFSEHHPVGPQGVPRAAERRSPSSMSWVVPWASYHWDIPGTLPQGGVWEASKTDARATSAVSSSTPAPAQDQWQRAALPESNMNQEHGWYTASNLNQSPAIIQRPDRP